ncbi:hypothetical protein C1H46_022558 [Malus baccata]|uniref:Uncharacterized protein n=1 Tax=Malus baccata TaxID=106549 RepID=A0A540LZI5_MALBA|nr:hypothetical protein C1H46_022558 [Malus baccata]
MRSNVYEVMLTLKTTKSTWRACRVIYKLTTSFGECGACQLVGPARPRSKFVDVALGARLTSTSCDYDRGRNTSRPLGFSNLKTRLLFLRSSISNSASNVPNVGTRNTSLHREG